MAKPSYPESVDLRWSGVFSGLKGLCTRGVRLYWIYDAAPVLLTLEVVQQAAAALEGRDKAPRALVALLRELVADFREEPQGMVLWIVLGLEDPYEDRQGGVHRPLEMSAYNRRKLAAEEFRVDGKALGVGTIRTYHEERALRRLASLVLAREIEITGPKIQPGQVKQEFVDELLGRVTQAKGESGGRPAAVQVAQP